MSPSKMRKSQAYRDGECHADGGPDLREQHAPAAAWKPDMRPAYDLGFNDHAEYLARERVPLAPPVGKEPCPCGHRSCRKFFLTGIGSFVQGSGFDEEEADEIIAALAEARSAPQAVRDNSSDLAHIRGDLVLPTAEPTAWIDGKAVEPEALPHAVTEHVLREVREAVAELPKAVAADPRKIIADLLRAADGELPSLAAIAAKDRARAFLGEAQS